MPDYSQEVLRQDIKDLNTMLKTARDAGEKPTEAVPAAEAARLRVVDAADDLADISDVLDRLLTGLAQLELAPDQEVETARQAVAAVREAAGSGTGTSPERLAATGAAVLKALTDLRTAFKLAAPSIKKASDRTDWNKLVDAGGYNQALVFGRSLPAMAATTDDADDVAGPGGGLEASGSTAAGSPAFAVGAAVRQRLRDRDEAAPGQGAPDAVLVQSPAGVVFGPIRLDTGALLTVARFLRAGGLFLVLGLAAALLLPETIEGTIPQLVAVFLWAFLLDLTFGSLTTELGKLKKAPALP
jgi:hypothetical protein